MKEYLIWSNEHSAWWRADSAGYTSSAENAGCYTRTEALMICHQARDGWDSQGAPPEMPILAFDVSELKAMRSRQEASLKEQRKQHAASNH